MRHLGISWSRGNGVTATVMLELEEIYHDIWASGSVLQMFG
jgi:hypothetical protein